MKTLMIYEKIMIVLLIGLWIFCGGCMFVISHLAYSYGVADWTHGYEKVIWIVSSIASCYVGINMFFLLGKWYQEWKCNQSKATS